MQRARDHPLSNRGRIRNIFNLLARNLPCHRITDEPALVSDALFAKLTKSCRTLRQIDKNQTLAVRTNERTAAVYEALWNAR